MYNLIEYSNIYSKTSRNLWRYYREEPVLTAAGAIDGIFGKNILLSLKKNNR